MKTIITQCPSNREEIRVDIKHYDRESFTKIKLEYQHYKQFEETDLQNKHDG